jgi:transposase-like protein
MSCYIVNIHYREGDLSMSTIDDISLALDRYNELDQEELKILETALKTTLVLVSEKILTISPTLETPYPSCPYCFSTNTIIHARGQTPRFRCKTCKRTYFERRQTLYYRRRKRKGLIDLIVLTHTTEKSIAEIGKELGITLKTYRVWKEQLIAVLPQLEEKFNKQRKK